MQQDAACGLPARRLQPAAARSLLQPAACGLQQPQRGVLHAELPQQLSHDRAAAWGLQLRQQLCSSSTAACSRTHPDEESVIIARRPTIAPHEGYVVPGGVIPAFGGF